MSRPTRIKKIDGGVQVWDYRGTGVCPGAKDSGGRYIRIKPLIAIEHIPVVKNRPGLEDFVTLGSVLKSQGLHLQAATDSEGNVALYNDLNVLCYQARGANQISYGVEHMHLSIGEAWTRRQLRAAAWIWQYASREYGIPITVADIRRGSNNTTAVYKKGHTSHQRQSVTAGYSDRSDPGPGFDWEYCRKAALFYKQKGHFVGV